VGLKRLAERGQQKPTENASSRYWIGRRRRWHRPHPGRPRSVRPATNPWNRTARCCLGHLRSDEHDLNESSPTTPTRKSAPASMPRSWQASSRSSILLPGAISKGFQSESRGSVHEQGRRYTDHALVGW